MPSRRREDALSEVIGFILILALIAVLASLYLTYVVPAQGREAEIRHMAEVNDQFLGYKTSVDSLWINDKTNVPISRTFTLGTLTGLTQGAFVVPLFQPYPSSGTMVVNGRGETITITADALVQGFPGGATPNLKPMYYEPDHIYVQVNTTNTSAGGGLNITPSSGNWTIWLNVTNVVLPGSGLGTTTSVANLSPWTGTGFDSLRDWFRYEFNPWLQSLNTTVITSTTPSKDLTITVWKNRNSTISEIPISRNITNNTWYLVDILDDAYGLSKELNYPFNLTEPFNSTSPWIRYRYPVQVGYIPLFINQSNQMGSIEYLSGNNYWIQQNYYYQQGGIFLKQPDGMVTKVVPLISITNKSGIPYVRIVDITITGSGNIGGTSPVQVVTRLDSVRSNIINGSTLAQGIPNARNITLTIDAKDNITALMWNQTFSGIKETASQSGFNKSWITNKIDPNNNKRIQLTVDSSPDYKLFFDYTQVNLTVELQPVAI